MKKLVFLISLIGSLLLVIGYPIIYSYFILLYILIVSIIAFTYKKFDNQIDKQCDIIIPVFNQSKNIFDTIKSIQQSNYKKYNIIVINDGSTDDTLDWIKQSQKIYSNIKLIDYKSNKGKKYALAEGIRNSNSEIIVTIDSDSVIQKNAIQNILRPFKNTKIGAVAGNVNVNNINQGLIPKLMDIIFIFSYQLIRSSQSKFGVVLCTPGALSAYKRVAVEQILDIWLQQKFLGNDTIIGQDRALTSLLIKNNWNIVYQQSAKAYTNMPITYKKLCKMLLRWVRGDIRENILLFDFVLDNLSIKNLKSIGLFFHYIIFNIGILAPVILLPLTILFYILNGTYFLIALPYIGIIMLLLSIIPMLVYVRKKYFKYAFHSLTYSIFSLFCLSWIPFYALLTLKNNNWLTRN